MMADFKYKNETKNGREKDRQRRDHMEQRRFWQRKRHREHKMFWQRGNNGGGTPRNKGGAAHESLDMDRLELLLRGYDTNIARFTYVGC